MTRLDVIAAVLLAALEEEEPEKADERINAPNDEGQAAEAAEQP